NLKVKGTDITSYTLCFQELALLRGRMFPEESDDIERYVSGLPEMIQGNVMSYEPKSMQKAIEFANDQMDQKLLGITDRESKSGWEWKCCGKSIWSGYYRRKPRLECRDGYVPLKQPLCFDFI
nr:reverse transcriptase domain-containing protein [Tanacetum cinerariifolium]